MSNPWIFMGVDRAHFSAKLRFTQTKCLQALTSISVLTS